MPASLPCHLLLRYPLLLVIRVAELLSAENCIKLFPEAQLNYMHNFLPSTTRRKQQNNHMCLTLLLIYEPMPSLPFCGITDILPQEEWKGLSSIITQGSFQCFIPFGGKKVAIAKMSPAMSQLGSTWFVFQAFIFFKLQRKKAAI